MKLRSTRSRTIKRTNLSGKLEKIGIIGGTFDPIHYGHLFAAEEAGTELCLDRVIFVPSGIPPHKLYEGMASPEERYEMTLLAISPPSYPGTAKFDISRIETDRKGKSYTLDTLLAMKEIYANCEIYFIVGMDAILDIMSWHEPFKIAETAKIGVIGRPGHDRDKIDTLPEEIKNSTVVIDSPYLDISGTDLRRRIKEKKSVRFLLPDPVYGYIRRNNLYNLTNYPDGDEYC